MVSPKAGDKGTIGSHSVWRYYLKQFSADGKFLHAQNVKSGKTHKISIKSATVCNDIYRLKQKITPLDVSFFKTMVSGKVPLDENDHKIIGELVAFVNNDPQPFTNLAEDKARLFQEKINSYIGKEALSRNQEELFTFYEENFFALYEQLLKNDSSFFNDLYNDEHMLTGYKAAIACKLSNFLCSKFMDLLCRVMSESGAHTSVITTIRDGQKAGIRCAENLATEEFPFSSEKYFASYYFIYFILSQYLRTQKHYTAISSLEEKLPKELSMYKGCFNYESIAYLLIHFQTYIVGINLIKNKFRILLLNNTTDTKFIISDQPIFDIYNLLHPETLLWREEFELYYPLKPDLAMLFTNRPCYRNIDRVDIDKKSVDEYNNLLRKSCLNAVYSSVPFEE